MMRAAVALASASLLLAGAGGFTSVPVRGMPQLLARMPPVGRLEPAVVIFLPGDGGWRGAAITISRSMAAWGYEVFGFDTKAYLEMFSRNGAKLSQRQLALDMRQLAGGVRDVSTKPVILVGWSQGAAMAVAAASGAGGGGPIRGVVTLGLPDSAVLGWDWKATLAILSRRLPDQPTFRVKPLLSMTAPLPLWMVYGSEDEYTTPATARELFQGAVEPKRLREIPGANHHFDAHQDELFQAVREALRWIGGQ